MFRHITQSLILSAVILFWAIQSGAAFAEKWRLEKGSDFKPVSAEDNYLLAVAEIKQLVNKGETKAVRKALDKLKTDYPEIAGPDLDAFIKAEMLLCQGKLAKAGKSYDKFLAEYPESGLYEVVLDRQFSIATAFLNGQKKPILKVFKIRGYAEGEKIMENISDRAGQSPLAIKATKAVADSLEKRGKFNEAYYKWSEISSRWPTGKTGKEALLNMGRCKHAAYKGAKYDASNLISAKSYYENFKLRQPKDSQELDIDEKLEQMNEQLAYKQFHIGQYYQRTGSIQSANLYYQMVIDNWPGTTVAKMAKKMISSQTLKNEKVSNEKK